MTQPSVSQPPDAEDRPAHTPGAWSINGEGPVIASIRNRGGVSIEITAPLRSALRPLPQSELQANARLIRNAPLMLSALKRTLGFWTTTGFADCDPGCDCLVEDVKAAIAAATGGVA